MDAETFSLAISSMKALSAHVSFTRTYQSPVSLSKTNEQQKKQKIRFFINIVRKTRDREEETEIRIQVSTRAALRNLARDVLLEKCLNGRFDSLRVKQRVSVEDVLITYEKKNQKRESADEANAGNNEAGSEEPSRGVIMDKDASLYSLVDAKIELCWPGNRLWYKAEVLSLDARARVAEVLFPAGDVETVELDEIINEGRLNVCARDAVPLTPKNLGHSEPFTDKNKKTQEEVQAPSIVVTKRQQIPNREGDCLSCGSTDSSRWYKERSQCASCYRKERKALNRTDGERRRRDFTHIYAKGADGKAYKCGNCRTCLNPSIRQRCMNTPLLGTSEQLMLKAVESFPNNNNLGDDDMKRRLPEEDDERVFEETFESAKKTTTTMKEEEEEEEDFRTMVEITRTSSARSASMDERTMVSCFEHFLRCANNNITYDGENDIDEIVLRRYAPQCLPAVVTITREKNNPVVMVNDTEGDFDSFDDIVSIARVGACEITLVFSRSPHHEIQVGRDTKGTISAWIKEGKEEEKSKENTKKNKIKIVPSCYPADPVLDKNEVDANDVVFQLPAHFFSRFGLPPIRVLKEGNNNATNSFSCGFDTPDFGHVVYDDDEINADDDEDDDAGGDENRLLEDEIDDIEMLDLKKQVRERRDENDMTNEEQHDKLPFIQYNHLREICVVWHRSSKSSQQHSDVANIVIDCDLRRVIEQRQKQQQQRPNDVDKVTAKLTEKIQNMLLTEAIKNATAKELKACFPLLFSGQTTNLIGKKSLEKVFLEKVKNSLQPLFVRNERAEIFRATFEKALVEAKRNNRVEFSNEKERRGWRIGERIMRSAANIYRNAISDKDLMYDVARADEEDMKGNLKDWEAKCVRVFCEKRAYGLPVEEFI